MQVLLIKRDIRLEQNYAFVRACEGVRQYGKFMPVFVFEPSLWSRPEYSLRHQNFVAESLVSYSKRLARCGGQLLQATAEIVDVLQDLHARYGLTRIICHQEVTDTPGYIRDKAVRAWAKSHGVALLEVEQNNVLRGANQPQEHPAQRMPFAQWFLAAAQGKVRDPSGKDLSAFLATDIHCHYANQPKPPVAGVDCSTRQKGGREEAERILRRFFTASKLLQYPYRLSSPVDSVDGCSRLSPYLAWGVVSHAEVARALDQAVLQAGALSGTAAEKLQSAARFYLDRLRWRMGYHAHSELHPETDTDDYFEAFRKPVDPDDHWQQAYHAKLHAMRNAKTGIPYIDACLRQLMATGYLSFRARSTTANFLCMGLGLHWRDVGEHLASIFLDFDGGPIHWCQHRIASGTGLFDSLLVYSVAKQARDFDDDCRWQKKWLPELRPLPNHLIHEIWKAADSELEEHGVRLGEHYPRALCDPELAMKEGKARVSRIRKGAPN